MLAETDGINGTNVSQAGDAEVISAADVAGLMFAALDYDEHSLNHVLTKLRLAEENKATMTVAMWRAYGQRIAASHILDHIDKTVAASEKVKAAGADTISKLEVDFEAELHPHIPRHSLQAKEKWAQYQIAHFRDRFA